MIDINRKLIFLNNHRILFGIYLFQIIYHFVIVNNCRLFSVNETTYSFYAVDYSMGFCSRILPGAIYRVLVGIYSKTAASIYQTVLYLVFTLLLSYLAEKFVKAFPDNKKECLILMFLFFTGPFTFSMIIKEFGMLDFHWMLLFVIACLFLQQKYLRFFIPLLVGLMNMVHYGAMVCYVAAILLLILFYFVKAETHREKTTLLLLFGTSLLVGCGSAVYFMMNDADNLAFSMEEFNNIVLNERHAHPEYFDVYFYKYVPPEYPLFQEIKGLFVYDKGLRSISELVGFIVNQIKVTLSFGSVNKYLIINIFAVFLFVFLIYILFSYYKDVKQLLKRFLIVLFGCLSLLIGLVGMIFSTDNTRWLGHSFIVLFVFVFYVLFFDYRTGMKRIQALLSKAENWFIGVILFFYANILVDPYTFTYAFSEYLVQTQ